MAIRSFFAQLVARAPKLASLAFGTAVMHLLALSSANAANATTTPGITDQRISEIRALSAQRCADFFRADAGKPLVRSAIKKNWNKRGDYTRLYGQSIVVFALRAFTLNEQNEEANTALRELCRYHLDRRQTLLEIHSFPAFADALARLVRFYGPSGSKAPGRITPETHALLLETIWEWAKVKSDIAEAEIKESQTLWFKNSENHHAQHFSTCWSFAMLLSQAPEYRDRQFDDGRTAQEHYRAWTAYLKEYLRQRAAKGWLVEIDSPSYASATLKGIYSLHDFSIDPDLKRLASQFLEVYWALWAQMQLDGVAGGAKTRTYADSAQSGTDFIRRAAWYVIGIGDPNFVHASMLAFVTSTWRVPDIVFDMALDTVGAGTYEVRERRLGLGLPGYTKPGYYRLRPNSGGIVRYGYRTPDFIMSTLLTEARPEDDWTAISAQNRWMGVIFRGNVDARIYPHGWSAEGSSTLNALWAAQSRGAMIAQKLKGHRRVEEWRVWISQAGLSAPAREGRWVFTEAAGAYAAVGVVRGDFTLLDKEERKRGVWLKCADDLSPVIIEVARKTDWPDATAFRRKISGLPVTIQNDTLTYSSAAGDRFRFPMDQSRAPEINGRPIDYMPTKVFDGPFVQSTWDSAIVTLQKGARKTILDFNYPKLPR